VLIRNVPKTKSMAIEENCGPQLLRDPMPRSSRVVDDDPERTHQSVVRVFANEEDYRRYLNRKVAFDSDLLGATMGQED
jgi:hypothetical protein